MILLHQFDPIAFSIGPVDVHWYGIAYALSFFAAWFLGRGRILAGRLPGVTQEHFSDLAFYAMLGVVLGGRLGYILFYDLPVYLDSPLKVFKVWEGGMSFHGGLLGVLVAAWLWSRRHRLHFFDTMDFVAPLVPAGLGLGRLANYVNGELWGKHTGSGWGVIFPGTDPEVINLRLDQAQLQARYAAGALDRYARHPSQLYEALLEGLVMFLVLWTYSARPRARYAVSGLFALLYGVFRFIVEFVRVPDQQLEYLALGWVTMGQLLSLPLVALGLFLLWRSRRAPVLLPVLPAADTPAQAR
ncbi:prolipoprotein diacylglyceryl transferase [Pseudoxanthomonas spadix]|jgi:phosphatidylglycerol:prolipoprotein diacylglycerol transferase|uniref:Phosphatidylglycerol--prolipoprotein diacylglyceryl transferase n=1 Tax=Pseudoxanthomonas spadix (strain BD-a59) TaxID=1045855 RepID=G7UQC1_PSEUP|nr:prolipoprotein diacylglyceryl transferase [Pseudoxanthomonas spadix]AER55733.1 prolipoprotein diacylglyceryl transferase [Pseudoxanthomonas spadix BD-a59]MBP3973563.1 prolipoprotein diacylglyceryl transferase [Pseudoxanthomonas spadix]RMW94942.1 prolipoprotein diacylglyceryl transferase [Pseudoxanthomonas spadix]